MLYETKFRGRASKPVCRDKQHLGRTKNNCLKSSLFKSKYSWTGFLKIYALQVTQLLDYQMLTNEVPNVSLKLIVEILLCCQN